MMKQLTLAAPRSTAATTGVRTRAAFRPSRFSRRSGVLRSTARRSPKRRSSVGTSPSARAASFSIDGSSIGSGSGRGGRGGGGLGLAGAYGHHVGVAQVDAVETELEDARALVEALQLHQRGL